jgi:rfaE bifunctional protein kinase chain/domain
VKTLKGKKALIVGDLMLDEYIWGNIKRISPEAPVPIVEIQNRTHVCGGAGNVAVNLASLEATVFLQGIVGDDAEAKKVFELLQETGIEGRSVISDKGRPTSTKVRIIAQGRQVARLDSECESAISEEQQNFLISRVEETIQCCDVAVLSDYAKGVLTPAVCQKVIAVARTHAKPVVVDPKGIEWTKYRGSTVVTPNVKEAEAVWGHKIGNENDLREAGFFLVEILGGVSIIITLGSLGMRVFSHGSESFHIPATAQNVFDVTGAGDTVVAVLALALASGYSLVEAARLANAGAGVVVGKIGTASLTAVELFGSDN